MNAQDPKVPLEGVVANGGDAVGSGIDHEFEKRLVKKLDRHIVPIIMLLYLFSFLDRREPLSVAAITIIWGIIATGTGFVQSYGELLACRLLLGAAEAGLFPGLTVYLTFFYTRKELALRIGYLFVSAALAGACGGLLAYAIGQMHGVQGKSGWRWILILEGLPSIVLGVAVFFCLADNPETASYLTEEEKRVMIARRSREATQTASAQKFHWEDVKKCFTDWKCWAFAFAQFGIDTMLYGFSTFLPTIIKGIGHWTVPQVQALTIPCYTLGAIIYLIVAHLSDKQQKRGVYAVGFACISILGYGVLLSHAPSGAHYFGCFLVAAGLYVAVGLPLAWLPNNCPRYGKRTVASAFQLTVGNASGIMAPFFWLSTINRRRKNGEEDAAVQGMTEEEMAEMGDDSPRFRYTI